MAETPPEHRILDRRQPEFGACPRYDRHELSEEQVLTIAQKAVELARNSFYADVGKSVTNKFFWVVGLIVVGTMGWLTNHGYLK